jgi:ubiquinone/menaquinone biosynthesis C-methylase UbiE
LERPNFATLFFEEGGVSDEVVFRPDLYQGVASQYDRFRLGYPSSMIDDLASRARLTGRGRLLDLACGTGQITFAMRDRFAGYWAVDQEPDMVDFVSRRAAAPGRPEVTAIASRAEACRLVADSFELVAVGNAFHRLDRPTVAAKVLRWLQPGRCLALLWSASPWTGTAGWQTAMAAALDDWTTKTQGRDRIPLGWDCARAEHPDEEVLQQTGFEVMGTFAFPTRHEWTMADLIGFVYSTSFLSRAVLGDRAPAFEEDLRGGLDATDATQRFSEVVDFGYQLARRPG